MNIRLYDLNKWSKRFIAFLSDLLITSIAWLVALWLSQLKLDTVHVHLVLMLTLIQCSMYMLCGLYRGVWRFASIPDLIRIIRAVFYGLLINIIIMQNSRVFLPLNYIVIYGLVLVILLSGTRFLFRIHSDYRRSYYKGKRILVVGAGNAGDGLIRDLYRSAHMFNQIPVAIVDDDPARKGCEVQGIRVVGTCQDIPAVVEKLKIDLILIAIPSASSKHMRKIVELCEKSKVAFRTLPGIQDITDGRVTINKLREVLIEDLLGREEVYLDWEKIQTTFLKKTILVTGGGGSIGSELCRQICKLKPQKLIIVDNNEFNLYSIDMELKNSKINNNFKIETQLCSVTDKEELKKIVNHHLPHLIFHVAAYKHVPLLETHIRVAMRNNIIGTKNIAELAHQINVEKFILISTDKAVNPTNIMGATKRAAEIYCQALNSYSKTRYITVRFGNVLNSAGSVIPLFRQQIQAGGPVTITHKDITRYFMTIPEASQLILQAAVLDNHGDIFILDMGEPISIRYLAEQMIKFSGKIVGEDISLKYIGLRPGEKLHEELLYHNEEITQTTNPKIKQAKVSLLESDRVFELIQAVESACLTCDENRLKQLLHKIVPEYQADIAMENNLNHAHSELSLSYV